MYRECSGPTLGPLHKVDQVRMWGSANGIHSVGAAAHETVARARRLMRAMCADTLPYSAPVARPSAAGTRSAS